MTCPLLRWLGIAVVDQIVLDDLQATADAHRELLAQLNHRGSISLHPADVLARYRRQVAENAALRTANRKQHDEIARLRNIAAALEEENALLLPAVGAQMADDIRRMLAGGGK